MCITAGEYITRGLDFVFYLEVVSLVMLHNVITYCQLWSFFAAQVS